MFSERNVSLLSWECHVDLELSGILDRDPQVVLGDRGNVACLWVVCLPRHRLIVTVRHERPLSTAKAQA